MFKNMTFLKVFLCFTTEEKKPTNENDNEYTI